MNALFTKVRRWHDWFFALISYAQSPLLLFVRLYWGWQLAESGWGKLHNLDKVTEFFASLNMPAPGQMAVFIASVEFFGGILFALGAFSRITSLVLTVNLTMAYVIADREALFSIFSDPDKFMAAAPFTSRADTRSRQNISGLCTLVRSGESRSQTSGKIDRHLMFPYQWSIPWHGPSFCASRLVSALSRLFIHSLILG